MDTGARMTVAIWVVLALLAGALTYLALVVAALVRRTSELRTNLDYSRTMPAEGVPVGTRLDGLIGETADGAIFTELTMRGSEWLLLFAHPGCAPCEELVPQLLESPDLFMPPTLAIVVPRSARDRATEWESITSDDAGSVVVYEDGAMSRMLSVSLTPYAFAIDNGGTVRGQSTVGGVAQVSEVLESLARTSVGVDG